MARYVHGCVALVIGVACSATCLAQIAPALTGPSVLKMAEPANLSGYGLPAGAAVTVVVQAPNGQASSYGAVVGGDGRLSYRLVVGQPGGYRITVTDTGGRPLVSTRVNFTQ